MLFAEVPSSQLLSESLLLSSYAGLTGLSLGLGLGLVQETPLLWLLSLSKMDCVRSTSRQLEKVAQVGVPPVP